MPKFAEFEHPSGDGRVLRVGACHKDRPDPSHTHYEATQFQPDELPAMVDLREHLTDIEDQGDVGSCTANALAGALEYLEKRVDGREGRVSRLFIYWNERDFEGKTREDGGACIADGIKALREDGACSEDTWSYDKHMVFRKPNDEAYEEAIEHCIDEAHRVKIDLHDMRHCLAEGYPFVFGLQIYDAFQHDGAHGRIRTPDPDSHEHCGGHAMLCVGYSDEDQVFVVRNSWGPDWGDGGYCYIPYDYMTNPHFCHDAWTIRKAHDLDFTQGTVEKVSFFVAEENEEEKENENETDSDEEKSAEELQAEIDQLEKEIADLEDDEK